MGALRHAPHGERLPEVLVVAVEARGRGGIEQAAEADRRVDEEARGVRDGGPGLPLQELVRGRARLLEVRDDVAYAVRAGTQGALGTQWPSAVAPPGRPRS